METTRPEADARHAPRHAPKRAAPVRDTDTTASAAPALPAARPNAVALDRLRGDGAGLLAPDVRAALFALRCV